MSLTFSNYNWPCKSVTMTIKWASFDVLPDLDMETVFSSGSWGVFNGVCICLSFPPYIEKSNYSALFYM